MVILEVPILLSPPSYQLGLSGRGRRAQQASRQPLSPWADPEAGPQASLNSAFNEPLTKTHRGPAEGTCVVLLLKLRLSQAAWVEFLCFLFCKLGHEGPALFGLLRELKGPELKVCRVEPAVY